MGLLSPDAASGEKGQGNLPRRHDRPQQAESEGAGYPGVLCAAGERPSREGILTRRGIPLCGL